MQPGNGKKLPPKVSSNFFGVVSEEVLAFGSFLLSNWLLILPGLLLLIVVLYVIRPLPPKTVTIATGQENSTSDMVGQAYQKLFHKYGVELKLVPSKGAGENMRLLEAGQVDAIFAQGGEPLDAQSAHVRSLGSIAYQPLWLFYWGDRAGSEDLNAFLAHHKTSINLPESSTRLLVQTLLDAHGMNANAPNLLSMGTNESVQAFLAGKIDALFLIGSMESKNIREVLAAPGVHLYDFDLAETYARRFPYLSSVLLTKGALNLHPPEPTHDIRMAATTLDILVSDQLHPAIQLLFLESTQVFDKNRQSLFVRGKFPVYIDNPIPESDVAQRYYRQGAPLLWGHAPYWVASLFDELWFSLLAIGAIIIPIVGFLPSYRKTHAGLSIEACYDELRRIERELLEAENRRDYDYDGLLRRIDALKAQVRRLWVPTGNRSVYYDLCAALNIVREDILTEQAK